MGNEAMALGAIRAGVRVVAGYPGTPSSEVLENVARHNDGSIYVEWSVNEKVGLEVAVGGAYAGARALATMKQMGMNVAADPLMSVNYVGVKGGLIILVADDPGPNSSQTEQDTRHYSKFSHMALFDPSTPEEAYTMMADAFAHSEKYGRPVFIRCTTRVCHSCSSVQLLPPITVPEPEGFIKDPKWVIFPKASYANKIKIVESMRVIRDEFASYEHNIVTGGGTKGVATGGVSYTYTKEALLNAPECKLFKVSTMPFPDKRALEFLKGLKEVLVIEELDPVIEDELIRLKGLHGLDIKILGKHSGHSQLAGEITPNIAGKMLGAFLGFDSPEPRKLPEPPPLPIRPPVMCAGCSHRGAFYAVKEATKGVKAVYTGDIGCYTLGNAPPLEMVDTCLCMGGGITVAQGLRRVEPDAVHFAFIGDSTFFHSGITGVVNAVYNQTDIVVVILDNETTAMTGNQPHPGMGVTMMGTNPPKVSIRRIIEALDVSALHVVNPLDQKAAKEAVRSVLEQKGVRVILFEAPCVSLTKGEAPYSVDTEKCTGCKLCVQSLGCPALSLRDEKAVIESTMCTGCGVCSSLCHPNAIMREEKI